jgi:Big-like domain-containing protein/thrombospondin type 3 repeat protein
MSKTPRFTLLTRLLIALPFVLVALGVALRSSVATMAPAPIPGLSSTIFINEIHYDNTGTDTGEFIEVAGPAGTDLTGWRIELYNGSGGARYDNDLLSGTIPSQQGGYGTVSISYPVDGIQNGSPDGIALVNPSNVVVQFLCYEGTFTASNLTASGLTCTDIGVSEVNTTPIGQSLQLQGTGTTYGDFTWAAPSANTKNAPNTGQTFTGGGGDAAPTVSSTIPTNGATGVSPSSNISITFSESVNASASAFSLECPAGTPKTFSQSASPATTFTLDPTADLPFSTICTVTVVANQITDADANDPPDQMAANFVFSFTVADPPVASNVIINEIDSDTPTTDVAEFVELYDGGVGNTSLTGLVVVFYNGSNDLSYASFDLDGFSTDANGYFVLGNTLVPGRDFVFADGLLQNGQDAVALYQANGSNFPPNTPVTTSSLIDAVVYDTDDADDPGLLVLLNSGEPQVNENGGGDAAGQSIGRCPNGGGGARNTNTYIARTPTPDGANNCPVPPVMRAIHEIQSSGATSPFVGTSVITPGIVTARKSNGFFMQDPNVDADPNTSEGIFVFVGATPTVAVGNAVSVTGTVTEFFNLTQISSSPSNVTVTLAVNPLPAPIVLTTTILNPAGPVDQLERFEGMRMHADTLVSVAPTNNFGETFTVLDGVQRPLREPGIEISLPVPPDPTSGVPDCCIPRWDENPERIMIDSDGLIGSAVISVTSNVTISNVTGPLDFSFSDYKVLPETAPSTTANMSAVPVPTPTAAEFTVAGYNIENFNGDPTQLQKAARAIRTVMHYPDVIGHVEIASLLALQALATQVNNDAVGAGDPNPNYTAHLIPAPGGGTQHVGFLVKTSRVQVDSVTQERATATYINPNNGLPETLHDRPPLVLRATFDPSGPVPQPVIVVVNHTRSFIDIELVGGDGPRVRAKRKAQGEDIADLLQELQTNNPTTAIISVGDYNAYQFNDGYTDPVATIKGTPTSDDEVVVDASPDVVFPDFINLTDGLPAAERYSFIFEGTPQALDHVFVNTIANTYLQRYAIARNNADFPELPTSLFSGNVSRPERNSDHDMPVAYFLFPVDADNDGVPNGDDNCPLTPNSDQANNDGDALGDACDPDDDNDGILDGADNCPFTANTDQANNDGDAQGDACDPDDDNDGVLDGADNCPFVANSSQANNDGDAFGDACDPDDDNDGILDGVDNCPFTANSDQANNDGDALGDACDPDDDNDGVLDGADNCPFTANPGQADFDLDGIGDACDSQTGPPTNKDQCKNGGWQLFDFPRTFKNQGDCIQFVNTGK